MISQGIHVPLSKRNTHTHTHTHRGFPDGSDGKDSACKVGDLGSIPRLGKSPGERNGYPLQNYSWDSPWTEEPGGLQSMGLQRVGQD